LTPVTAVSLEVPHEILASLRLPPEQVEEELKKDLAVALYARGALSFAQAGTLTDLTRREFDELLGERRVPRQYDERDLAEDAEYARGDR
jgi:predicted HTH domain antitoxin